MARARRAVSLVKYFSVITGAGIAALAAFAGTTASASASQSPAGTHVSFVTYTAGGTAQHPKTKVLARGRPSPGARRA
jgi:hypothetical protein